MTNDETLTPNADDLLLRQASGGDAAAFAGLLSRYRETVVRVAHRLLGGDRAAAEDVAQEAFLRLWNASVLDRYEARGSLRSYLLTVACRLCTDYRRRERPTDSLTALCGEEISDPLPTALETLERAETARAVRDAVSGLPDDQRTVFVLSHYEGLKYREIAEIVGCPVGTVASRKFLAVAALRDRLRPLLPDVQGENL